MAVSTQFFEITLGPNHYPILLFRRVVRTMEVIQKMENYMIRKIENPMIQKMENYMIQKKMENYMISQIKVRLNVHISLT